MDGWNGCLCTRVQVGCLWDVCRETVRVWVGRDEVDGGLSRGMVGVCGWFGVGGFGRSNVASLEVGPGKPPGGKYGEGLAVNVRCVLDILLLGVCSSSPPPGVCHASVFLVYLGC